MLTVLHINGPINSGKSTVGRALSGLMPSVTFIDGDDHDAPDEAPLPARIEAALRRIEAHIVAAQDGFLVAAYPLEKAHYEQLRAAAIGRGARFLVLTLAPPLGVALMDRGARRLSSGERKRIAEMYEDGYQARSFSDLILDTSQLTIQETAERACSLMLQGGP
jgi:ABC-type glutathione transport system ATPase component